MSDGDIEEVSFLPGDSLNRKSMYEPSAPQRCKQLVCSQGRATAIIIVIGLFLLIITLIASFARPSATPCVQTELHPLPLEPVQAGPKLDYISTNGEPFPWKDVRLPRSVLPLSYDLTMHPNITESWFSGTVVIAARVTQVTNIIVFHIKELNISHLSVRLQNATEIMLVSQSLEYKGNEQYYIELKESLRKDQTVMIEVFFRGELVKKLAGFYKSSYETNTGETRYLATTHFEPTDARAAFPCFDEPDLKATFKMSMTRDKGMISLFNMPWEKTEPSNNGKGLEIDIFQTSVKMSTYLVAFVVCDYGIKSAKTKSGKTVRVLAPHDQINQAQFALDAAVKVLDNYDDFFGVPYPLPKQDLIAIPDFAAGAMENWGLITYRMTAILYDPLVSSASNQQWVAIVIAHELAHQWFGNLVTMEWWEDLWLNEGFASFVEFLGSEVIQPEWHMKEQFVKLQVMPALYKDSLKNSHPIQIPVGRPEQINEIFDAISYSKGSAVLRMLQNVLGESMFKKGLTAYLKKYQYGNARTKDLWDSLSEVSQESTGVNVSMVMDTWTKQMGYPVVTLKKQGNQVVATQERFLLFPESSAPEEFNSTFNYKWQIPFTYNTDQDPAAKTIWLKGSSVSFQVPPNINWLKGNVGMYGYYRVNYDQKMWTAIIQQLNTKHTVFSVTDRAELIDDVFSLAFAGRVTLKTALDLSEYLVHEEDYIPLSTALENLDSIEQRIENIPIYKQYKLYLLKLLKKLIDTIGWEDEGSILKKYLRSIVLTKAIILGHKETVNKGKELFQQWMTNTSSISPNLKMVIYRAGMMYGGEEEWEFCWQNFKNSRVPSEKGKMLSVLGMTRDARLLNRYLGYSLNEDEIRSQDTSTVLQTVSVNAAGQILAWRFFQQNWPQFYKRYGESSFSLSRLIASLCSSFSTEFDYEEVKNFFSTRNSGSGKRAVQQSLETIQMNINWLKKYKGDVIEWFSQKKPV